MKHSTDKKNTKANTANKKAKNDSKKLYIIGAAVIAVILIAIIIVAIVMNRSGGYKPEYQKGTTIISKYYKETPEGRILPTSSDRHDITLIEGGGKEASVVEGGWIDSTGTTHYLFDGDCRGILLTDVDKYTFMYSAQDGKLGIDIDFDGGEDFEYNYKIEGDKLTLTRVGSGQVFEFTKEAL